MNAGIDLTVCDVCNALFLGTGWCHDRRTAPVNVPVRFPEPPPKSVDRVVFDRAFDEVYRR